MNRANRKMPSNRLGTGSMSSSRGRLPGLSMRRPLRERLADRSGDAAGNRGIGRRDLAAKYRQAVPHQMLGSACHFDDLALAVEQDGCLVQGIEHPET